LAFLSARLIPLGSYLLGSKALFFLFICIALAYHELPTFIPLFQGLFLQTFTLIFVGYLQLTATVIKLLSNLRRVVLTRHKNWAPDCG